MADRISGLIALAITLVYGFIAFSIIKAPFQYDPLGPESWPQILSIVATLCCLFIIVRPDKEKFKTTNRTLVRLAVVVVLLSIYARSFEPIGFIGATAIFCAIFSKLLGASYKESILFGLAAAIFGQILCVNILDLNLPAGLLSSIL